MQAVIVFLSLLVATSARFVKPDALTGDQVRQIPYDMIMKMMTANGKEPTPFEDEYANVKTTNGFKTFYDGAPCEGDTFKLQCPGQRTAQHEPPRIVCISAAQLCDSIPQCPGGEDEDRTSCVFWNLRKAQGYYIETELNQLHKVKDDLAKLRHQFSKLKNHPRLRNNKTRHQRRGAHHNALEEEDANA